MSEGSDGGAGPGAGQPFSGRGRFFLLRHGETDWNRERRVMGRKAIPLNDEGRAQVERIVPYASGLGISAIWTSPLPRAVMTAEVLAAGLAERDGAAPPIHHEAGFTEVDYAAWEGLGFAELLADPEYHRYHEDPVRTPVPGGGESLLDVRARVLDGMSRVAAASDGAPVVVISHGDPLRLILTACMGLDPAALRRVRVDNAALSAVETTGDFAEVKFVNMRPDLAAMMSAELDGARAVRAAKTAAAKETPA